MRMLFVTVTVSPTVTGNPSTSIDTVSTGGLAALGVQLKKKVVPVIRRAGAGGEVSSGGSAGRVHSSTECMGIIDACMFSQTVERLT